MMQDTANQFQVLNTVVSCLSLPHGCLQLVGLAVLEREERLDPAAAAVADDHDDLHLEGADGVLDSGPDAGVPGLQAERA
jgi:hypothetical protein